MTPPLRLHPDAPAVDLDDALDQGQPRSVQGLGGYRRLLASKTQQLRAGTGVAWRVVGDELRQEAGYPIFRQLAEEPREGLVVLRAIGAGNGLLDEEGRALIQVAESFQ